MVNGLHLYSNLYSAAFLLASRSWVYRHHIKGKKYVEVDSKERLIDEGSCAPLSLETFVTTNKP